MMNATVMMRPTGSPLPFFRPVQETKKARKRLISRHFRGEAHMGRRIKDDVWIDPACGTSGFLVAARDFL